MIELLCLQLDCCKIKILLLATNKENKLIKHIVFWRLNESAYGNDKLTNAQILKDKLLAMQASLS